MTGSALCLAALLLFGAWCFTPAAALPGNSIMALCPASATGDFDVDAYIQDPSGWPAGAQEHPNGWSIAYGSQDPPPGWTRPFLIRGGAEASAGGDLHPRFQAALEEMLPVRNSAILALLSAPDTAACSAGKPNPHPFYRDGWLFAHDGVIDIEEITMQVWREDWWGAEWGAFKSTHPRDYDGNADSTRGNAGEIYFLALLYELAATLGDVQAAFRRTLMKMCVLQGCENWQFNAILQSPVCTWVLRYALAAEESYCLFYGLTTSGEYCIVDSLPGTGSGWVEIPNFSLAAIPSGGTAQIFPIELSAVPGESHRGARHEMGPLLRLRAVGSPCVGVLRLRYEVPIGSRGLLEIWDTEGRRLALLPVREGAGTVQWSPPPYQRSSVFLARLRADGSESQQRVVVLQ